MKIHIPSPLRSYTHSHEVEVHGETLAEALAVLDRQFPGIRFRVVNEQDRIREHIKFFVNEKSVSDIFIRLEKNDAIHIVCALSGG
ncbi:MoaD/ThiS family protein [bacterium]|nr:MoaD/ThiS family protein [bacterium]